MNNYNDMFLFSKVVEYNGITGAAHALGMARSKISRRISELEASLDARLIQRTTRHFAVTDLGKEFNKHCLNMIHEADAAFDKVAQARDKPAGLVRMSCPAMLAQYVIGPLLPLFMREYPEICIAIETANREVSIEENFDISFRIRQMPYEDSSLIVRSLGIFQPLLVASPELLDRRGRPTTLDELTKMPIISYSTPQGPHVWTLVSPEKTEIQVRHQPTLIVDDFVVIRQAALQGSGVTLLPLSLCLDDIRSGALEIVLPEYRAPVAELLAVFPSRHGIVPAVRSILDFLAQHCAGDVERGQITQHLGRGRREHVRFWVSRQSIEELVSTSFARHRPALAPVQSKSG
ncbi:LysR family transcriptional regulator [Caulobacter soli]|uniref:LysR family transcriptional regulator n=1 Tax=Caulobacter soli TaxID=2708539 RepID=UPI0013EC8357|nr:LysR family transcriptional regulator [Caulobacter soli]